MALEDQRRLLIARAAALITAMYALLFCRLRMQRESRPQICYGPLSIMDEERKKNLDKIYNCTDIDCISMLRMRRAPFFKLCQLLRETNLLRDSLHSNIEEQVAMFLHIVGHNQRFRVVMKYWRRSIETVHRNFKEVLYAIGELRQDMIKAPMKTDAVEDLTGGKTEAVNPTKSEGGAGSKRKRSVLAEDDVILFTGMTDAVKDVADAIRSTKVDDCHPELYGAVMFMPGFTDEELLAAYGHLLDNKAQGTAFVNMNDNHRVLWVRTFLAKHHSN